MFQGFVAIDIDRTGEISVASFHKFLGVPQTKFSERVFGILDLDGVHTLRIDPLCQCRPIQATGP
jgi:hypothetical protein